MSVAYKVNSKPYIDKDILKANHVSHVKKIDMIFIIEYFVKSMTLQNKQQEQRN